MCLGQILRKNIKKRIYENLLKCYEEMKLFIIQSFPVSMSEIIHFELQ